MDDDEMERTDRLSTSSISSSAFALTRRSALAVFVLIPFSAAAPSPTTTMVATSTVDAATPTNAPPNAIEVKLSPGLGNEWCVYSGQLGDASLGRVGIATIASVTNRTPKRIVLIHWDTDGARIGPISVNVDGSTADFNGMPVSGVWEAHVSGSEVDAPQHVTLNVTFDPA